jgi:hypothetical protein
MASEVHALHARRSGTEQPFDRTGTKLELSDPQVRIDLWKTLKDHRFQ